MLTVLDYMPGIGFTEQRIYTNDITNNQPIVLTVAISDDYRQLLRFENWADSTEMCEYAERRCNSVESMAFRARRRFYRTCNNRHF